MVLATCALSGCAGGLGGSARYVGPSPPCEGGGGAQATLVRTGGRFALAPADGAVVVRGTIGADGRLAGTLDLHPGASSPAHAGSRPAALTISLTGTIAEEDAVIDYAAGACRAMLHLSRVHPPLL